MGMVHPERQVFHAMPHIYQYFQEHEKVYESNPQLTTEVTQDTLYP